jgi:hypothetical protein
MLINSQPLCQLSYPGMEKRHDTGSRSASNAGTELVDVIEHAAHQARAQICPHRRAGTQITEDDLHVRDAREHDAAIRDRGGVIDRRAV